MKKPRLQMFLLLLTAGLVLAFSAGVQLWDALFHPATIRKEVNLQAAIPMEITGWTGQELPLAETEEVKNAVFRRLDFNDFVSRIYLQGDIHFTIYLAYWEPLQMPVRQVGSHTPDVCWVLSGWDCTAVWNDVQLLIPAGATLKSAEMRTFEKEGYTQHVLFWHMVDGKIFKAQNRIGMWDRWNMLTDHLRFGLNQKPEQFFIRVAANVPLDRIWDDPGFQEVMSAVSSATSLAVPEGEKSEDWTHHFRL